MKAAILGAGVIGAGWAARFLLHGWDVAIFDPAGRQTVIEQTLTQGRMMVSELYATRPPEGQLTHCNTLPEAIDQADWIQESLPEDLALKQQALQQMNENSGALLCSSTSGFTPTALGANLPAQDRLLVCHPFNPVYLLPVVEVVPHVEVSAATLDRCMAQLRDIGMKPVHVRKEIDAHIADRLLEAMWREALWLVKDGVATTEEIDTLITHGFGLRWAQMGLFDTYRLGGGEAGLAAFLAQFGPALEWPWSRLTDVPALDEELINTLVTQSDAQSGHLSNAQMMQQRDQALVAILQALKEHGLGAGDHFNR